MILFNNDNYNNTFKKHNYVLMHAFPIVIAF